MTTFLRLLQDSDKASALLAAVHCDSRSAFEVNPVRFREIPGTPFSYWISQTLREMFVRWPRFEGDGRTCRVGLQSDDDFRFVRVWWESAGCGWVPFSKGGRLSQYYADLPVVLNWNNSGRELKQSVIAQHGNAGKRIYNEDFFFRRAITWPLRASRFSPQALPAGSIFSIRGYTVHTKPGDELATLAVMSSAAFDYLFKSALGRFGYPEFIVGTLQSMPWPTIPVERVEHLAGLAAEMWRKRRGLTTADETSHAYLLPVTLQNRLHDGVQSAVEIQLSRIQAEIDEIAFNLYGFSEADRLAASDAANESGPFDASNAPVEDDEVSEADAPSSDALLSWAIGVAFGRFDWRLATGERQAPPEPEPFDPLPAKSPGMLPDGAAPFHGHPGILADDPGHPHDLARLVEEVLERVKVPVPSDVRRWLQKDFFPFHLQRYSKSRRKAPIYWPLATESGSYTLWIYYPTLSDQTLYRAVNDFVEPKLKQVSERASQLRSKSGGRTRAEEREFEEIESLEVELTELRDSLLKIAAQYHPNQGDGVQITAVPLWPLFRHKPWQKVLKDTWGNLEKGEYDWAHLAMSYWPERVREKCKTDKSLAIAHGLEELYEEPAAASRKKRAKRMTEGDE